MWSRLHGRARCGQRCSNLAFGSANDEPLLSLTLIPVAHSVPTQSVTSAGHEHDKGTLAILTGGGDVPGLNPAIRAITIRALREGYRVIGIRRGWAGLVDYVAGRRRGQLRQHPGAVGSDRQSRGTHRRHVPAYLADAPEPSAPRARAARISSGYTDKINDITKDVLKNLEHIGVDVLIPIGGDDTLSYGKRLHDEGMNVVAIPKTMDNDVYGTDYCIGFSTCVTRTIELTHRLRTSAGSHERFLVIEVFGRYAGFTALLPTMAGAADRCVIPEHPADRRAADGAARVRSQSQSEPLLGGARLGGRDASPRTTA